MGGATRFMTLLTTPFPPIRPSLILLHRRLSSLSTTPLRLHTLSSSSKTKTRTHQPVKCFHSQPNSNTYATHSAAAQQQQNHHPWPEWTHFLNILSNGQGYSAPEDHKISPEDAFVVYEQLTDEFVTAASACIAFARARPNLLGLLSRKHIEAVVSNGTPFLFKSALNTARRIRAFLGTDGGNVSEVDQATTIDLMKYIISYASNPASSAERNGLYSRELVESSVRTLLHELGSICAGVPIGYPPASGHQFPGREGHTPKPFGQNIEMKRGDWICSKCNFMNFARNMKCLECEEPRPKKQLIGGEWECTQCNFFNYGRNMVCLRCDCRRPGAPLFNNSKNIGTKLSPSLSQSGSSDFQYPRSSNSNDDSFVPLPQDAFSRRDQTLETSGFSRKTTVSNNSMGLAENLQSLDDSASQIDNLNKVQEQTEKSERWFKRMAELQNVKDLPSAVSDEDFPEIMPMRKGENRFVVSKKKDRSLTSPQYKRQVAMDQANNTNFVPFVPFPPDYFAKKDTGQSSGPDSSVKTVGESSSCKTMAESEKLDDSVNSKFPSETSVADTSEVARMHNQPGSSTSQFSDGYSKPPSQSTVHGSESSRSDGYSGGGTASQLPKNENVPSGWRGTSLEGSGVKEPDPLDMSEEAKAERWFKRVAQIKDISELSQIPDEDFPSIMPMRKGVNRFVVSKRKTPLERRLTSQQYRRNLPVVTNDSVKKESDNS
ncbi:hypothetical protein ACS0TY_031892 [Phlomoides rotata]